MTKNFSMDFNLALGNWREIVVFSMLAYNQGLGILCQEIPCRNHHKGAHEACKIFNFLESTPPDRSP